MEYRSKIRGPLLAVLGAVGSLGVSACAEPSSAVEGERGSDEHLGSLGLALELAPDVVIDSIEYEITGNGFSTSGSFPVSATSTTFSAQIGGIPVGQGYQIRLSSRARGDAGLACAGSATFSVTANATAQVTVALLCDTLDTTGGVAIGGTFNVCPSITSTTISPTVQSVGGTVALGITARDVDQKPAAISYSWSAASGTLSNATVSSPVFTCTQVGPVSLQVVISDGSCTKPKTLSVQCVAASSDAGAVDSGVVVDAGPSGGNVVINEIESNGGTPDDWVELYNPGSLPLDVSGWGFRDNDASHAIYKIPAGVTIAAGGYYVLDTGVLPSGFPYGLGGADSAILYAPDGVTIVDRYDWTAHAASTYGRCPNGVGPFVQTSSSRGVANVCPQAVDAGVDAGSVGDAGGDAGVASDASSDSTLPWPGPSAVTDVDLAGAFASNLSGLSYQAGPTVASSVLWAVQNGPSMMYRLRDNGSNYVNSTDNGWAAGKLLVYPGGTGAPDTEGVAYVPGAGVGSGFLYVSTERDNNASTISRLSVLQFDAYASGTTLTALHDWNLTPDLPAVGANLGLEAITFVSDAELSAQNFREGSGQAYNENRFAQHGGGIFLVGVEGTGMIHAYALNHADNTFAKLASFSSGMTGVMDLAYDPDTNYLWAYGDDSQGNRAVLLEIEQSMASLSYGQFVKRKVFNAPSGLPPVNNEGISFAPESECAGGLRSFFWSDDNATSGHSLRRGSITCGRSY